MSMYRTPTKPDMREQIRELIISDHDGSDYFNEREVRLIWYCLTGEKPGVSKSRIRYLISEYVGAGRDPEFRSAFRKDELMRIILALKEKSNDHS